MTGTTKLPELLERVLVRFPKQQAIPLRPSVGEAEWAEVAERYPGGHARRWFEACDGQGSTYPFYNAHTLMCLGDARDAVHIADEIRAEPGGYWIEPHWLAIAEDGAGQHIMIDDRDGRVLAVAHDDDSVTVLAGSPEAWLQSLLDGLDEGSLQYDSTFGLVETKVLEDVVVYKQRQAERQSAPMTAKQKLGLVGALLLTFALMGLLIWWLETHR